MDSNNSSNEKMYVHVLFLFIVSAIALPEMATAAGETCPRIISREEWGARAAPTRPQDVQPATHVLLHHSATPTCNSQANCAPLVRALQKRHMLRSRHSPYADIRYNFLIGEDGNVYEGVGWGNQGTHERRMNEYSLGVCLLGDFTSWLPNDAAFAALNQLVQCAVDGGHLAPNYKLITHRQVNLTDCPGQRLYNHVRAWDHWAAGP